ncbi:sulfonate ABC transporter substrate-binding protein [Paracidovorax valerianellae]|uniref:Putative aliphatic sulfonates-binding protein n=1 Tax=Paracidovorax valerianellae TaxID=187868 RepID=A0A1G6UHK4_9BURK|nr:sulfonate ABC transporter substrate-binding protein [Paracidovorax valerianellae]MDA8446801.1 sulfonate ABC transporter substrate-binding protein [Paracidovorax valerianellae]SDD40067.1 sulfonate transport system substrate-binding protein [Paracidovorax valerianellae]
MTSNFSSLRRKLVASGFGAALATGLPSAFAQKPERTLRVGHQKGWLSLLKARGTLEKRLAPLGVKVTWTEFNAGPVQLEALNVGSIDFGDVGEAPPIFAQAAGAPLVYVGATVPRPQLEAVVVPKGSTIRSVAELKGLRIALNKGSNVHYLLVKVLEKHGLHYRDVQPVFLAPPDARAAFEKGAVDAWVIWDPFLASAQKTLQARVLADATGVANNRAYYFSSRDYSAKNADVLRIAIQEVDNVDKWISANKADAAVELSSVLGLDRSVTELFVGRAGYGTSLVSRDILAEQQVIADTFFDLKLIPRKLNLQDAAPVDLL